MQNLVLCHRGQFAQYGSVPDRKPELLLEIGLNQNDSLCTVVFFFFLDYLKKLSSVYFEVLSTTM